MRNPYQKPVQLFFTLGTFAAIIEGAFRKWIFASETGLPSILAYFSKDILFVWAGSLALAGGRRLALFRSPLFWVAFTLMAVGGALSFLAGFDLKGAVLSLKNFFVLPLAALMVAPYLNGSFLRRYAIFVCVVSLPIAILGGIQFVSPRTSPINTYSDDDKLVAISNVSDHVRATGTFSYITGMTKFGILAFSFGLITSVAARRKWIAALGAAGAIAGVACVGFSLSRGGAICVILIAMIWVLFARSRGSKAPMIVFSSILLIGLALAIGKRAVISLPSEMLARHDAASDTLTSRLLYQYATPIEALSLKPLGDGFGVNQAGSGGDGGDPRSKSAIESPWGRTILEVGALGFLGFILLQVWHLRPLVGFSLKKSRTMVGTVVVIVTAHQLASLATGYQFNHTACYFFWSSAAFGMGCTLHHRLAQAKRRRLASRQPRSTRKFQVSPLHRFPPYDDCLESRPL